MSEVEKLANTIKSYSKERGRKASEAASSTIGTIEQLKPMVVSTSGGECTYEEKEEELIFTETFYNREKKKGDEVLVVPVNNLKKIAIIDIIRR
jgi:hypothetical protein